MQGCRALPGGRTHTLGRHGGGARRLTQQLSAHGEVLDGPALLADIHRDVALRHPLPFFVWTWRCVTAGAPFSTESRLRRQWPVEPELEGRVLEAEADWGG